MSGSGPAVIIVLSLVSSSAERIKSTLKRLMPEANRETRFLTMDSDELEM